jgi:hypothetical protein
MDYSNERFSLILLVNVDSPLLKKMSSLPWCVITILLSFIEICLLLKYLCLILGKFQPFFRVPNFWRSIDI